MKRFFRKQNIMLLGVFVMISLGACEKRESVNGTNDKITLEQETENLNKDDVDNKDISKENTVNEEVAAKGEFSSFVSYDLEGNEVTQDILADADLTVLNIWGTFCGPCIREMPELGEIAEEYTERGVQIIGLVSDVSDESGITKAKEIVEKTGANYLHILPTQDLYDCYLKDVMAVPETLFLDRNGNILDSIVGANDKATWISLIDAALENLQ
ncbi:TlpA family protein disulfide reductase [Anaerosporobacter sp.]|uniref:TlpA family protein disulfide reductase n=1 Tax=Anaerosporobacter sp. TaxID=1872529 RepID=UPI00286F4BB6|nr:TlpA disulfide reductase family protein [Anaerosporobacter sp.]